VNVRHGIVCACVACAIAGALNFGDRVAWLPQVHSPDHLPEPQYIEPIAWALNISAPVSGAVEEGEAPEGLGIQSGAMWSLLDS
jgi:hypothetical protein